MSLVVSLEHGPRDQAIRQMRLDTGALVIGRGADADWRIDDPDMFVSRAHCTILAGPGGFTVTDTSTGGLFVDDARAPLGTGNSAALRDGTRLRLGDFLLRVRIVAAAPEPAWQPPPALAPTSPVPVSPRPVLPASAAPPLAAGRSPFDGDDFFASPRAEPGPSRPTDLPDAFEKPVAPRYFAPEPAAPARPSQPFFDDPFTLDPLPSTPAAAPPVAPPPPQPIAAGGFDWHSPAVETPSRATPAPEPAHIEPARPEPIRSEPIRPTPVNPAPARPEPSAGPGGRDAFLRGLGLDPAAFPPRDADAEMEEFGRACRLMLEGLMHLLRKRAREKDSARVSRAIVGAVDVNPLKFMPTADAALATMIGEGAPGFLGAEAAVTGAVRDLAQHHVDAWRGVQSALAGMIDRFDPAALEQELKAHSALTTLLAGGRRARLWELYEERYREIARSAEQRFLGEVGADFRDAYENSKGD